MNLGNQTCNVILRLKARLKIQNIYTIFCRFSPVRTCRVNGWQARAGITLQKLKSPFFKLKSLVYYNIFVVVTFKYPTVDVKY